MKSCVSRKIVREKFISMFRKINILNYEYYIRSAIYIFCIFFIKSSVFSAMWIGCVHDAPAGWNINNILLGNTCEQTLVRHVPIFWRKLLAHFRRKMNYYQSNVTIFPSVYTTIFVIRKKKLMIRHKLSIPLHEINTCWQKSDAFFIT